MLRPGVVDYCETRNLESWIFSCCGVSMGKGESNEGKAYLFILRTITKVVPSLSMDPSVPILGFNVIYAACAIDSMSMMPRPRSEIDSHLLNDLMLIHLFAADIYSYTFSGSSICV